MGRSVRDVFPEVEGQEFFELLDQVYETGVPVSLGAMPIRFADDAGAERYVDFIYQPVRDDAGQVTGIFVGGYDVTGAVRDQAALRESEARYRTLFDTVDVGFCVIQMKFDETGSPVDYLLVEINPAFERQTGLYGAAGKWVSEAAPGLERHWFELYGAVARTGEPARFENEAVPLGRWYDVHAFRTGAPLADPDPYVVGQAKPPQWTCATS